MWRDRKRASPASSASFADFEAMRRQGVNPHNGELNGMLRLVVADPATTLRSLAD
jgi:phosphate starvation-inducible PhoH-like protein